MQPLTGSPRDGLDPALLAEAASLARGATVRHGVDVLDGTDSPTGQSVPFETGEVSWGYRAPDSLAGQSDKVAEVRRTASLTVPGSVGVNLFAVRLRIWTDLLLLSGQWARFFLGVFDLTNPGALADDGLVLRRTLTLADKSYRWSTSTLTEPLNVPAGTVVLDYLRASLTSRFGESRFAFPTSTAQLGAAMTFETGTSLLEVYSSLLNGVGFDQLIADELGRPATVPLTELANRGVEQTYGAGRGKVLVAGSLEPLLPSLPNVLRFSARQGPSLGNVEGNGLRTILNQSTGPASIDARGGLQVELRVDVDADSQPVLDAIATADAGRYFAGGGLTFDGSVALNPRHSDRDVIALDLPRLGLTPDQTWQVTSWKLPLGLVSSEQDVLMPVTAERRITT